MTKEYGHDPIQSLCFRSACDLLSDKFYVISLVVEFPGQAKVKYMLCGQINLLTQWVGPEYIHQEGWCKH